MRCAAAALLLRAGGAAGTLPEDDFLVARPAAPTSLTPRRDGSVELSNGLISRRFRVSPNWATVSLRHDAPFASAASGHAGGWEALRGVSPEARVRVTCPGAAEPPLGLPYPPDGLEGNTSGWPGYAVGGLRGQQRYAFLDESRWDWAVGPTDWRYAGHETGAPGTERRWAWRPQRGAPPAAWPPRGLQLRVRFVPPPQLRSGCTSALNITVVYEMYDGVPAFAKWVEVSNAAGAAPALVEQLVTEELHISEHMKPRLHVETDFMPRKTFWAYAQAPASDPHSGQYAGYRMNYPTWWIDPDYEDDLHDQSLHSELGHTTLLLQLQYPLGPWQPVAAGATEHFYIAFVTVMDSDDEERRSLTRRRVVRTLFPQVTEAPLYFYSTDATSRGIREIADQCAATGFEAIILSFGSGFDPSSTDPQYIARVASDVAYAHSKGVIIGGYTLMQNPPGLSGDDFCKDPDGPLDPHYNTHIADFTTAFHRRYRDNIRAFLNATGMDMLETDGPYEGATCATTRASGFAHANNSQVAQARVCQDFYRGLKRDFSTYLTVPDPYWMSGGTNKEPMGYTDAWNRIPSDAAGTEEYLTMGRMYLYDGTFHKPTTMGWMAFELSRAQPLGDHLPTLDLAAASYLGQGNVPCYRGARLYDADPARALWARWVAHYKRFRPVLMSDPVHVKRPTGADWEFTLHVNAAAQDGAPAAFGTVFNPTSRALDARLSVPLYYAAVRVGQRVRLEWGGSLRDPAAWPVPPPANVTVLADYTARTPAPVPIAPRSFLWFAVYRLPGPPRCAER